MLVMLALATTAAVASPLPMAVQGSYCDFYTGQCESPERFILRQDGTVERSYELYGSWSTPAPWGTWSWDGFEAELLNDVPNGWPFKLALSHNGITPNVTVYEDTGTSIMVSDVYDFEVDRIVR